MSFAVLYWSTGWRFIPVKRDSRSVSISCLVLNPSGLNQRDGVDFRCYGFAAGRNAQSVKFSALVELDRNIEILQNGFSKIKEANFNLLERRLIFFAQEDGRRLFDEVLRENQKNSFLLASVPRLAVDTPIYGEWSRVCKVHRILFDGMYGDSSILEDFAF